MKKKLILIIAVILGVSLISMPVFADCVPTAILNGCTDNGGGAGVCHILNLVVDILTIGIGILGVVGISVVGIQYLTAGGSEEKTRKAKRRLLEIVLGLVAYAVVFALLKWLALGNDGLCGTV